LQNPVLIPPDLLDNNVFTDEIVYSTDV